MVPELRNEFNRRFREDRYQRFVEDLNGSLGGGLDFRVCESPLFFSDRLANQLVEAAQSIVALLRREDLWRRLETAVPAPFRVPGEEAHPTFLQVDLALSRDETGEVVPRLIELQGFPSLYCFQYYLDLKIREHFPVPEEWSPYWSGLSGQDYVRLLQRLIVADSSPENVILLEVQPERQKTRIDFESTRRLLGIPTVCPSRVRRRGNRLYYKKRGKEVPIQRIYNRVIFEEAVRLGVNCDFCFDPEVEVSWVGHPSWYFKVSKLLLPFLQSPFAPPCRLLQEPAQDPPDPENYVLKPLFSFAGSGVEVDLYREKLATLVRDRPYLLQRKVEYAPVLRTPDGNYSKAEVRMMFVWDEEPLPVNNLIRFSQGKMLGVSFNRDRTWVGSSIGYHRPPRRPAPPSPPSGPAGIHPKA